MPNPFRTAWDSFWGVENEPNRVKRVKKETLYLLLHRSQVGIRAITWMQAIILILWATGAVVPGYGFYDGTPNVFNAISHPSFWVGFEIFVLMIGQGALSFDVNNTVIEVDDARTLKQLKALESWLVFWLVMLVVAIGANITHIVACGVELSGCTSTLCMNYSGFLISFIVLLSVLLVIEVVAIYYACVYKRYLRWTGIFIKQLKRV